MRILAILRPGRQVAPEAHNKVAYWQACQDYVNDRQADGSMEAYYWTNVLPTGLSAPKAMAGIALLNVPSIESAQDLLEKYPGATEEEGLSFELIPVLNSERSYQAAENSGYRYLAMGKPTPYKARPAKDKQAFETACSTYLQNLNDAGTIEYLGWAYGPEHVPPMFS